MKWSWPRPDVHDWGWGFNALVTTVVTVTIGGSVVVVFASTTLRFWITALGVVSAVLVGTFLLATARALWRRYHDD